MAEDSNHWQIAAWLRAKGGMSGDGTKAGFLLQEWQDKGWHGDTVAFRTYKKDSWAVQAQKWEEWRSSGYEPKESWWSGGYEPKEQPASTRNAADWSDWKPGVGTGGGGGGGTVPAPWHRAREERASSSGGGGYEPREERASSSGGGGHYPREVPAAKAQPASSSRARSESRNKIAKSPAPLSPGLSPEPFSR
jgi:hypothetical protein